MDVRVVKERVLRTLVAKRVGSNPTPCTSELSNDTSEVKKCLSAYYMFRPRFKPLLNSLKLPNVGSRKSGRINSSAVSGRGLLIVRRLGASVLAGCVGRTGVMISNYGNSSK